MSHTHQPRNQEPQLNPMRLPFGKHGTILVTRSARKGPSAAVGAALCHREDRTGQWIHASTWERCEIRGHVSRGAVLPREEAQERPLVQAPVAFWADGDPLGTGCAVVISRRPLGWIGRRGYIRYGYPARGEDSVSNGSICYSICHTPSYRKHHVTSSQQSSHTTVKIPNKPPTSSSSTLRPPRRGRNFFTLPT